MYVLLLDHCSQTMSIIRLTDVELSESVKFDDFEEFLETLEERYEFRLKNCSWMKTQELDIYRYENGNLIEH